MNETNRASLVSVTTGMANTMTRGRRIARVCKACNRGVPAYPGRYPAACPMCGGALEASCDEGSVNEGVAIKPDAYYVVAADVVMVGGVLKPVLRDVLDGPFPSYQAAKPAMMRGGPKATIRRGDVILDADKDPYSVLESVVYVPGQEPDADAPIIASAHRYVEPIQALIEVGQPRGESIVVPYAEVERQVPAGVSGFDWYTEGAENGKRYRVEGPHAPVLIVEFDDERHEARLTPTDNPKRYLGFDPRAEMVEDGGWDEGGFCESYDPYASGMGLSNAPGPLSGAPAAFLTALDKLLRRKKPAQRVVGIEVAVALLSDPNADYRDITGWSGAGERVGREVMRLARKHLAEGVVGEDIVVPAATRKALERSVVAKINRDNKSKVGGEWDVMIPKHAMSRAAEAVGAVYPSNPAGGGQWWRGPVSAIPTDVLVGLRAVLRGKLAAKHFATIKAAMGITESALLDETVMRPGTIYAHPRYPWWYVPQEPTKRGGWKGLWVDWEGYRGRKPRKAKKRTLTPADIDMPWKPAKDITPEDIYALVADRFVEAGVVAEGKLDERGFVSPATLQPLEPMPADVAGDTDEDYRASAFRSQRDNRAKKGTAIHGTTRFVVGGRKRRVSKNIEADLQRKRNARRGQAKRVQAARKFHDSPDGRRLHRDLGHYNRGKGRRKNEEYPDSPWLENALGAVLTIDEARQIVLGERFERGQVYEVVRRGASISGRVVPGIGPDGRPGWEGEVKLDVGALVEYSGTISSGPWNPMVDQFVLLDGALGAFPERGYGVLTGMFYPSKMGRADSRYLEPWEDQFDESAGLDERDPYGQDTSRWLARGGPRGGGAGFVTQADLDSLERVLDGLFSRAGMDIEFTRHFLDRVNDRRNKRQITIDELSAIFHEVFQRHANKIKGRGADWEAVIADLTSDINIPFVLNYDRRTRSLELVAKTVMRKRGFKTRNKRLTVTTAVERAEAARAKIAALTERERPTSREADSYKDKIREKLSWGQHGNHDAVFYAYTKRDISMIEVEREWVNPGRPKSPQFRIVARGPSIKQTVDTSDYDPDNYYGDISYDYDEGPPITVRSPVFSYPDPNPSGPGRAEFWAWVAEAMFKGYKNKLPMESLDENVLRDISQEILWRLGLLGVRPAKLVPEPAWQETKLTVAGIDAAAKTGEFPVTAAAVANQSGIPKARTEQILKALRTSKIPGQHLVTNTAQVGYKLTPVGRRMLDLNENSVSTHPDAIPPLASGMATETPSVDDLFDSILRRLIVIESSDVLEDVNFDEHGSIYLFFDPSLSRKEVDEVHKWVQTEHQKLALVASPNGSLPEEQAKADWWVMFLPGDNIDEGTEPGPDPAKYARPEDANVEGPRRQMMVSAPPTAVDQIAMTVDTDKLMKGLGESARWLTPLEHA